NSVWWIFNAPDQRVDHLVNGDESEACRRVAQSRDALGQPQEWDKRNWPPMPRAQNIPRPNECSVHATFSDQRFALTTNFLKHFHDWRRLGHTEIDEMTNAAAGRGIDCSFNRNQIDRSKLGSLSRTRVRDSNQLHEHVCWRNRISETVRLKR